MIPASKNRIYKPIVYEMSITVYPLNADLYDMNHKG